MRNSLNSAAWSLRKKILLSMVTLLLLLGLSIALITGTILLGVLKTEFQRKGISTAKSISANSIVDVLTQNTWRLKELIENEKRLDLDAAYIFITDASGRTIAHTFNKGFPVDLLTANNLKAGEDFNIQALDTRLGFIYDIAVPIFLEKSLLGRARVGILQNRIQATINKINLIFLSITALIIFIGTLLAYKISSLITKPVSKLVEAAQSIQKGDFSAKIDIRAKDEIGALAIAFNAMAASLREKMQEVKRLSGIEERNRLALDLHDGCAQDIANIIKRVELCEKLFLQGQDQGMQELNALKMATKDFLQRTRGIIFNLKSSQEPFLDLNRDIFNYVNNYRIQNNIHVVLTISGLLRGLSRIKTKDIFYIIVEALNNIKIHSQANNVQLSISMDSDQFIVININDDGRGFDVDNVAVDALMHGKLGLMGMRQRVHGLGGDISIVSKIGQGTKISVSIPTTAKETEL
jgi:signal transduction histidine kinase